jgi:steroid 5-alpha reductase family enzyme
MQPFPFDTYNLLFSFLVILGIQLFMFFFAMTFHTDRLTDLSYGMTFVILVLFYLITQLPITFPKAAAAVMVTLWGLRLALYLFIRIIKIGRDTRFDNRRDSFVKFGAFWSLQAVSIWIILLPVTMLFGSRGTGVPAGAAVVGIILWVIGFSIEFTADQQKFRFRNNSDNRGTWIRHGLWKFSRHPNYFGEIICWWGLFVFVIPFIRGMAWLSLIGPVHVTVLLLFVSGIPVLEKQSDEKYGTNEEYLDYKKRTSVLVPLPPKKKLNNDE